MYQQLMSMQQTIERKLSQSLAPSHLEVINETHMHNVPPDSESHFKVIVVSDQFNDLSLIKRHQAINVLLKSELAESIHALSLKTFTPQEWSEQNGSVDESPPCLGGSKADLK